MKISTVVWAIVVVVIVLGAVFWYGSSSAPTPIVETSSAPSVVATPTLTLGTSTTLGAYLSAASNGLTLYTYADDQPNISNCTGSCTTTWPPYLVQSSAGLEAGAGITGTLSTLTRADGTLQVAYNGLPLYFYSGDVNPGDTNGNGAGGVWSIAKP